MKKTILSIFSVFTILIGGYFLLNLDSVNSNAQIKDQRVAEHNNKKMSLTKNIYLFFNQIAIKGVSIVNNKSKSYRLSRFCCKVLNLLSNKVE